MISHRERFHLGLIVLHSLSALKWNTFSPCDFQCFSNKWILREFDADRICWNRNWNSGEIHNIVMMTTVCYCFASCFEHATWFAFIVIHIKIFMDPVWCFFLPSSITDDATTKKKTVKRSLVSYHSEEKAKTFFIALMCFFCRMRVEVGKKMLPIFIVSNFFCPRIMNAFEKSSFSFSAQNFLSKKKKLSGEEKNYELLLAPPCFFRSVSRERLKI